MLVLICGTHGCLLLAQGCDLVYRLRQLPIHGCGHGWNCSLEFWHEQMQLFQQVGSVIM